MRTDVKLGIVTSMAVVLAAGGYFLFRSDAQAPIPVADKASPTAPKSTAKPPVGKQPVTNPSRQVNSSKDAAGRTSLPVNRDQKVVTKPAERPAIVNPKERTPSPQPATEPFASAPTAPVNKPTIVETKGAEQNTPAATQPSFAERSTGTTPTPVSPPAGALPSAVPGTITAREPDAGHASRTLMADSEPAKTAPAAPADSATPTSPAPGTPSVATKSQLPGTSPESKPDLGRVAVETHRVQPGDSLASLAQSYYGNSKYATFLAESNPGISDPAKLALGTMVRVPPLPQDIDTRMATAAPAKAAPAATGGTAEKRTYKVKSGDSFYKIAKEQLGNAERWKELLDLNKAVVHGDPTQLQPGQTLILPNS